MGKNTVETDTDIASDDMDFEEFGDEEFDLEEIFKPVEVTSRKRNNRRAKNARRLIEQYWEDRKLAQQLDEYYLHPDG